MCTDRYRLCIIICQLISMFEKQRRAQTPVMLMQGHWRTRGTFRMATGENNPGSPLQLFCFAISMQRITCLPVQLSSHALRGSMRLLSTIPIKRCDFAQENEVRLILNLRSIDIILSEFILRFLFGCSSVSEKSFLNQPQKHNVGFNTLAGIILFINMTIVIDYNHIKSSFSFPIPLMLEDMVVFQ